MLGVTLAFSAPREHNQILDSKSPLLATTLSFEQKGGPMLTGRKFKLERATLALDVVDGHRRTMVIPAGEVIKVVAGPTSHQDQMVDILWQGRVFTMFTLDVNVSGTEVAELQYPGLSARA